jgi:aminoglycoside 6'-N-acetyltransferase
VEAVEAAYGPVVDGEDPTEAFIAELDGRPFGYVQRYLLADYPAWGAAVDVERAAGIDYMIGEVDLTGIGLGTRLVDSFTTLTLERYPDTDCVTVAVQQANRRSWRALERAGYHRVYAGSIASDDPSDDGPSYTYVRPR